MSGSDGTESQCDRISEATKVAMGDVLTKEQNNDAKKNETTDSDDECAHKNLRQEADGAPDVLEVGPEPVLPQRFRLDTENTVHRGVSPKEPLSKKDLKTIESLPQKHERNCLCEACKSQRVILKEKVECVWRWQSQGLKLRKYIQSVFDAAIESLIVPNATKYQCDPEKYAELKEIVEDLSKEHPHILFLMLVVQAQEFVVELKIRIIDPVQDTNFVRIAEIFLTRLLNGYDRLISTAVQVSELIKPLEDRHLNKFNLTWEFFNKKLYQNYIYFYEPTIRNILPIVVCYLRKPREGQGYQVLLERYLAFVDEMMQIAGLWSEKELLIDKYNVEQVALIVKNRKINAKDWKIRTNDEIMKLDSDREMDVPGFGIRGIPKRLFKKSATVPNTNSLDTEFVRKVLDTWGESMYHSMAQNFMGLHMSFVDDVISEIFHNAGKGPVDDDPEYYFGYQKAAWLVLSRPDKFTDAETQCSICREASWVSNLVVGGRTKEGTCAHPVLQQNSTKTARSREEEEKNNSLEQRKECLCIRQHLGEWQVRLLRGWLPFPPCLCALELRRQPDELCPCMQNRREQLARIKSSTKPVTSSVDSTVATAEKKKVKNVVKKPNIPEVNSTQTQTRHSTTQTPNSGHSHGHNGHQGRCPTHGQNHGTPPEGKNTPNSNFHRPHNHNSHSCNKQTSVESIKKLATNELSQTDGDCSDSGSSHEDSCSTSSSTARESSRHCDCCYCEVFGHGVPPVAPVSRNYNEMKERLRQLLTKKKALSKCKGLANCSPPMSPAESVLSSNTNSRERSNTPLSTVSINQTDQRDLDTLVNFIEGKSESENKKDNSKSEKKARQKQKKLDEALKKEKDEQERQKLVEFRKKTPEVTITVVDPQKPASKKHLMNRNLPEVSILPAVQPTPKQSTVKKELENKQPDPKSKKNETKSIRNNTEDIQKSKKMAKKVPEKNEVKKEGKKTKKVIPEPEPVPEPVPEPEVPLTKRERKELRREMRRKEEEKAKENVGQDQPQIVTIKRVMESSSAEPTVTITLKGHTPAEDKVLFTLINGQTKENSKDAPQTTGKKKKKNKGENIVNPPKKEVQQLSTKTQVMKNESKNTTKQQTGNDKQKNSGQKVDEKSGKMPVVEVKSTKSKKDKKNAENKQPEGQQIVQNVLKDKSNQQDVKGKKQNKIQPLVESKIQENVVNVNVPLSKKEKKAEKKHRQSLARAANELASKQNIKIENQKPEVKVNQNPCQNLKQKSESQKPGESNLSNFGGQLKETSSKINIENLKLPPGITITKVDGPSKPIPIKSTPLQKQPSPPKQATIIAAPMTGMQSNYGGSQSGGNVIVVDTGKLKQDLLPKNGEKGNLKLQQQQQQPTTTGKKKKKKKNNASNNGNNPSSQKPTDLSKTSKNTGNEDHAKILHNPATNMVTIRNPAFSPAPKMEPTQQAAIIKVSENGMVTIRSPALQQAINAGLTPPPKPDFIVKGDLTTNTSRSSTITSSTNSGNSPNQMKNSNGMMQSSLAELRSRLTPDCTGITGLARMQINKVANGQPIPENGINLMGTSVTLTKVKNPASLERIEDASQAAMISSKGKKKKKNGSGTRQCGDDWNLVESVFTPKDIDLEDGEMDDAERELEAFKRFCLQSVPPPRKEKVKLNIKDIVLKKKSSSSSTAAAVITAN